jgi:hypothetical protein
MRFAAKQVPPKRMTRARLSTSLTFGINGYTSLVVLIGQFFFKIPASQTIELGFGNERFGWIMLTFLTEASLQLWEIFTAE